ncbi:MAG: hypothetical protein U0V74_07345 [Chitinophagales bacterium]
MTKQDILKEKPLDPELLRPQFWQMLEDSEIDEAFQKLDELTMELALRLQRMEQTDLFKLTNQQALDTIRQMERQRFVVETLFNAREFAMQLIDARKQNRLLQLQLTERNFQLQCTNDALIQTHESLEFTTELCEKYMDQLASGKG